MLETNGFRIDRVALSLQPRVRDPVVHLRPRHLRELRDRTATATRACTRARARTATGCPDAHGHVYGIEIRNCNSHDNNIGSSGTAGNGTWFHNNRFHHNAIGVTTDSFAGGHPGMPQDASKWTDNLIYSNNKNIFSDDRDAYCKQPAEDRDPTVVCPTFQVPVGTGILIAGGNDNIVEGNYIFDNWRRGTMLHWVPASFRGEPDPAKGFDTSNNNAYVGNCMGIRPPNLDVRPTATRARARATRTASTSGGTRRRAGLRPGPAGLRRHRDREGRTAGAATSARTAAQPTSDPPRRCRPAPGSTTGSSSRTSTSCSSCCRAPTGTRRRTRTRPGATGSRCRPSRTRRPDRADAGRRRRAAYGPPSRTPGLISGGRGVKRRSTPPAGSSRSRVGHRSSWSGGPVDGRVN